jgi:hypothetical protein
VLKAIDPVGLEDPHVQAANELNTKASREHESFVAQAKLQEDALNNQYLKALGEQGRFGAACEMSASCWQQATKARANTESIRAKIVYLRGKVADEAEAFAGFQEAYRQTLDYYRDIAAPNLVGDGYVGPAHRFMDNQKAAYDQVHADITESGVLGIYPSAKLAATTIANGKADLPAAAKDFHKWAEANRTFEHGAQFVADFAKARSEAPAHNPEHEVGSNVRPADPTAWVGRDLHEASVFQPSQNKMESFAKMRANGVSPPPPPR